MRDLYDVIVIGAGPAGSMAAKCCAEYGLKTILLDKDAFPRDKPCGGGVSKKALDLVGEALPEDVIENYIYGFEFYSSKMERLELKSREIVGITTERSKFDAFLVDLARKKGAEFRPGSMVVGVEITSDGARCRLKNGEEILGKIIVGADGAQGIVARKLKIREGWSPKEIGVCAVASVRLDAEAMKKFDKNFLGLYYLDRGHGYGWVFPRKGSISIGIGTAYYKKENPREIFKKFCKKISEFKSLPLNVDEVNVRIIPSGGFKRRISTRRALLAGDAAGFVDPLSGEGIYYAMKSGIIAAKACRDAVKNNTFDEGFLKNSYDSVCEKELNGDLRIALWVSFLYYRFIGVLLKMMKGYSGEGWAVIATGKGNYLTIVYRFAFSFIRNIFKT